MCVAFPLPIKFYLSHLTSFLLPFRFSPPSHRGRVSERLRGPQLPALLCVGENCTGALLLAGSDPVHGILGLFSPLGLQRLDKSKQSCAISLHARTSCCVAWTRSCMSWTAAVAVAVATWLDLQSVCGQRGWCRCDVAFRNLNA